MRRVLHRVCRRNSNLGIDAAPLPQANAALPGRRRSAPRATSECAAKTGEVPTGGLDSPRLAKVDDRSAHEFADAETNERGAIRARPCQQTERWEGPTAEASQG